LSISLDDPVPFRSKSLRTADPKADCIVWPTRTQVTVCFCRARHPPVNCWFHLNGRPWASGRT